MEYNPNRPYILGQEWVPIREEPDLGTPLTYGPVGTIETGHSFATGQTRILADARIYSTEPRYGYANVNITAQDDIRNQGPVRRVIIPVNNTSMTGATGATFGFSNAADGQTALASPEDNRAVRIPFAVNSTVTNGYFRAYFGVNQYANLLSGKRILYVNLLYSQQTNFEDLVNLYTPSPNSFFNMTIRFSINNGFLNQSLATAIADWTNPGVIRNTLYGYTVNTFLADKNTVFRVGLGNLAIRSTTPFAFPWTFSELQRFEISAASDRLAIQWDWSTDRGTAAGTSSNVTNELHYAALEVIYCDETRVATGTLSPLPTPVLPEVITVPLYGMTSKTTNHPLPAGKYVMTVGSAEVCEYDSLVNAVPWAVKGVRELYPIPSFATYELDFPHPYDETIEGKTVDVFTTTIVPQISLHTTGGAVLQEVHVYGNQAKAQVYGTVTAGSDIFDGNMNQQRDYAWMRFYARRFGDTRVPLRASRGQTLAQITTAEFDALPEIIDGWKEVTLPIANPTTMGAGGNPPILWDATGELVQDRWELLGVACPSLSATPGNLLNLSPSFARLGAASYGNPTFGTGIHLTWAPGISPLVASSTVDNDADIVVLFSTNPQTPPNFAVTPSSMALATVNPNCAVNPDCIPRSLSFNALTWAPISGAAYDSFSRVVASGWGTSDLGDPWIIDTGTAANFLVDGTKGIHRHLAGASVGMITVMNTRAHDYELLIKFGVDVLEAPGSSQTHSALFRFQDGSNYYQFAFTGNSTTRVFELYRVVASSFQLLKSVSVPNITWDATNSYYIRARAAGANLSAKLWEDSTPEPAEWMLSAVDTTFLGGSFVGWRTVNSGTTGGTQNFYVDSWSVSPVDFGATEIQRYDPVDGQFNTIMLCTNPATTGFSDFEARVGQPSVYRIRNRNLYDFAGLWSPQVTGTVATPGVVGASIGLMLFTTNAIQDGSSNLAYSSAWEGAPVEGFSWPEAGQVTLQNMYGKNFPTAFHALERGGEAFSRSILVSAAGIPLATKENGFEDLRDMAWDAVPYICVRDELGNRWYSLVTVPEGSRRRMVNKGHLLISTVNVVEVSDTPYPVDP